MHFLKNWRTTVAGLATLGLVGYKISAGGFDPINDSPLILSGIGLIAAKDATPTATPVTAPPARQ
jgi:hypothetical protein